MASTNTAEAWCSWLVERLWGCSEATVALRKVSRVVLGLTKNVMHDLMLVGYRTEARKEQQQ